MYAASQDDTLGQDNEFFSISILLYDLFTFFSFYKILKNSNCGALLFFCVLHVCKKYSRSHYLIPRKTDSILNTSIPLAILKK